MASNTLLSHLHPRYYRRFTKKLRRTLFSVAAALLLCSRETVDAQTGDDNPTGASGEFNGNVTTAGSYDPYTGNATRSITDIVVPGSVGGYPLALTRTMNTRFPGTGASAWRGQFGSAGTWRHNYGWAVRSKLEPQVSQGEPGVPTEYIITYPDGRDIKFTARTEEGPDVFWAGPGIPDRVHGVTAAGPGFGDSYEWTLALPDGGTVAFVMTTGAVSGNRTSFSHRLTRLSDQHGLASTVTEISGSLWVTQPGGRALQLVYANITDPAQGVVNDRIVSRVVEWLSPTQAGREVQYNYQSFPLTGSSRYTSLSSVSYYGGGLTAAYTYQSSNNASLGARPLIATCDDVLFSGRMSKIGYDFVIGGAYGELLREKHHPSGAPVSQRSGSVGNSRTEIRGDGPGGVGPSRTFTYLSARVKSWTDFKAGSEQAVSTQEHINGTGFVSYVIDGRGNRTDFGRHPVTGNVTAITHPLTPSDEDGVRPTASTIYNPDQGMYFAASATDERGNQTIFTRDPFTQRVTDVVYPDTHPANATEHFHYNSLGQVDWHQLRNGYYEHFEHDSRGLLIYAWNPVATSTRPSASAPKTTFAYYALGHAWQDRVMTVTDPRNKTTTYEYEANGRGLATKVTFHDQKYRTISYSPKGDVIRVENELRQPTEYDYDDYHRVVQVRKPHPLASDQTLQDGWDVSYYDYTPAPGISPYARTSVAPTTITSATGLVTSIAYDLNLRAESVTQIDIQNADESATTKSHYDKAGNLDSATDGRNNETTFEYDQRNRRKKATSPHVDVSGLTDPTQLITAWLYDAAGNLRLTNLPDGRQVRNEYDAVNRPWKEFDQMNRKTEYNYWPSGAVKSVLDANNHLTQFEYDPARDLKTKVVFPDNSQVTGWEYDDSGNMITRPTPGGPKQSFTYDHQNRPLTMRWDNGIDFSNFTYEAGRLESARNPFALVTRQYDVAGRMILDRQKFAANPETVLPPTVAPLSAVSRRVHGSAGTFDIALPLSGDPGIESRAAGSGSTYQLVLDFPAPVTVQRARVSSGIGRVASVMPVGNQLIVNLEQVSNAQRLTMTLEGLSNGTSTGDLVVPIRILAGDVNGNGSVTASDKGQVQAQSGATVTASNFRSDPTCSGTINASDVALVAGGSGSGLPASGLANQTVDVVYRYDRDGKRTRIEAGPADANQYWFDYSYDGLGRPKLISRPDHQLTYDYDLSSNVVARRDPLRGTAQEFPRDALNRPTARVLRLPVPGSNQTSFYEASYEHYAYDKMSRLTGTTRDEDGGKRDEFGYNWAGELAQADYGQQWNGTAWVNPARSVTYLLDNAGNRNGVVDSTLFTPNVLNQYEQTSNGSQHEIAAYANVSYDYLADGPLAQASSVAQGSIQYGYDALGRRVRSTSGSGTTQSTTWFVYDGPHAITEYNSQAMRIACSLYGIGTDELIARDNYGTVQYFHQDRLGNVSMVSGGDGSILETYRYDAFGAPWMRGPTGTPLSQTAINNRFLFAGREWVSQFAFYEFRARAYNPQLGRFMSEDPLGSAAGDINLFRYCNGDPVNFTDSAGENRVLAGAAIGAAVGIGVNVTVQLIMNHGSDRGINWTSATFAGLMGAATGGSGSFYQKAIVSLGGRMFANGVTGAGVAVGGQIAQNHVAGQPLGHNVVTAGIFNAAAGVTAGIIPGAAAQQAAWNAASPLARLLSTSTAFMAPLQPNWNPVINGVAAGLSAISDIVDNSSGTTSVGTPSDPFGHISVSGSGGLGGFSGLISGPSGLANGGGLLPFPVNTFYGSVVPIFGSWTISYGGTSTSGLFDENGRPVKKEF